MSSTGRLLMASLLLAGILMSLDPCFGRENECEKSYPCSWGTRVCAYNSHKNMYQYFRSENCLKRKQCRQPYWTSCPSWEPNSPCSKKNCNKGSD